MQFRPLFRPQFRLNEDLVKNADDNWPTASVPYPQVIAVGPAANRDDSRESLAE
jgi:hypothetical protein